MTIIKTVTKIDIITDRASLEIAKEQLSSIIDSQKLPLLCKWIVNDKINNKFLKSIEVTNPSIIVQCNNSQISVSLYQKPTKTTQSMKVSLDWHKLQRRVVTAGKKSELLLQACKLATDSIVIDATAGFGHDSLILASTLSEHGKVIMIEQNPIMALLLILEKSRMRQEPNWQGLMSRLDIQFGSSVEVLQILDIKSDVIYLDPMFPNNSYTGAKVGKGMQILHNLVKTTVLEDEIQIFSAARSHVKSGGRIVVKRPKHASYLAGIKSNESWKNDVLRFDGYFVE